MIGKHDRINLTIAAFETPIANLFQLKDGEYVSVLRPLRILLNDIATFGFFKIYVKIAVSGQFGRLTSTGYHDGVLGMIQNGEADSAIIPISLDTPEPPGWFTPVIQEESYYIYSIPTVSAKKTQDISQSLIVADLMFIWLTVLIVIYALEIAIVLLYNQLSGRAGFWSLIGETLSGYAGTIFGQFIPDHGNNFTLIRIYQGYILIMSMCLFNATFNTSTVIGENQGKIDSLGDVVKQDKIPIFLEGLSLFELFQTGVTRDHRQVYQLAQRKQITQPFGLTSTDIFETLSPDYAVLVSEKAGHSGTIIPAALGNDHIKRVYQSKKPYHRGLLAYIVNPKENGDQIKRRLSDLSLRALQGDILSKVFVQVLDQFLLSLQFLQLNYFDLIKRDLEPEHDDRMVLPLQLTGIKILFQAYGVLISIAILVHLGEHLIHFLMK